MSSTHLKIAILGRKIGMTRFFLEDGKNIPVIRKISISKASPRNFMAKWIRTVTMMISIHTQKVTTSHVSKGL